MRRNSFQFTFLLFLGLSLVGANLAAILQGFLCAAGQPAVGHHFLISSASASLTALLAAALYFLNRFRATTGGEQRGGNQLQAARPREEEEWQQTFDTMSDLVSVHARDFKIVRANSALCEFLGKKREDVIGRYCYQLFHDRDTPIDGCPHAKAQQIGHAVTMEINDPHQGIPLLITCSPFVDQQGNFAGSVHLARIQTSLAGTSSAAPPRFIPICASCKNIRDENENWVRIEDYVRLRFNGQLTHSICKECQKKIYPEFFKN